MEQLLPVERARPPTKLKYRSGVFFGREALRVGFVLGIIHAICWFKLCLILHVFNVNKMHVRKMYQSKRNQ